MFRMQENNFLIEANKSYWDEAKALADFGKIDYEEITFCIKAKNDYKPDGTFY